MRLQEYTNKKQQQTKNNQSKPMGEYHRGLGYLHPGPKKTNKTNEWEKTVEG